MKSTVKLMLWFYIKYVRLSAFYSLATMLQKVYIIKFKQDFFFIICQQSLSNLESSFANISFRKVKPFFLYFYLSKQNCIYKIVCLS